MLKSLLNLKPSPRDEERVNHDLNNEQFKQTLLLVIHL